MFLVHILYLVREREHSKEHFKFLLSELEPKRSLFVLWFVASVEECFWCILCVVCGDNGHGRDKIMIKLAELTYCCRSKIPIIFVSPSMAGHWTMGTKQHAPEGIRQRSALVTRGQWWASGSSRHH